MHEGSLFSTSSSTLVIFCLFDNRHCNRCEVISPCGLTCISLIVMLSTFSYICWPFICLLWRNVYSSPLPNFKNKFISFIYLFLATLGLCCWAWAFSGWGEWGLLCCGARASDCSCFSHCRARSLGAWALGVVACGISCSMACGIFPDQGSNPCPLHWQADS